MTTREKTGGRQKGTPNKTTADIRAKYQLLIEDSLEGLKQDLAALEPKDRIKAIIEFSRFVIPVMKATELTTNLQPDVIVRIMKTDGTSEDVSKA